MKKILKGMKPLGVAIGVSIALASGPVAALTWYSPSTSFEDDDLDFHYTVVENEDGSMSLVPDTSYILNEGDVLIAALEIGRTYDPNGTGEDFLAPDEELTGIAAIQVIDVVDTGFGTANILFGPVDLGLNAVLGLGSTGVTVADGDAGEGAMVALWLDDSPDFSPNPPNCATISECIDLASDGALWQVDGFSGEGDEGWVAIGAQTDTSIVLGAQAEEKLGSYNYALSILTNNTGKEFGQRPCPVVLQAAGLCTGDGLSDLTGSGDVLGGAGLPDSLITDGVVARSDFDFGLNPIPEPATLALMATGLIGFGAVRRRKAKA